MAHVPMFKKKWLFKPPRNMDRQTTCTTRDLLVRFSGLPGKDSSDNASPTYWQDDNYALNYSLKDNALDVFKTRHYVKADAGTQSELERGQEVLLGVPLELMQIILGYVAKAIYPGNNTWSTFSEIYFAAFDMLRHLPEIKANRTRPLARTGGFATADSLVEAAITAIFENCVIQVAPQDIDHPHLQTRPPAPPPLESNS